MFSMLYPASFTGSNGAPASSSASDVVLFCASECIGAKTLTVK